MSEAERVRIVPVKDRRARRAFIKLPWSIYRDDPAWVPPLVFERRQALDERQPFFAHARVETWLALDDDQRPIGRISAQIDHLHQERYGDHSGYFGMLEALDDPAVFTALTATAEGWLRERGMQRVVGPFNLGVNQEVGLLVDGFETPPYFMMGHARRYYDPALAACGYRPAKDLLAYELPPAFAAPKVMARRLERLADAVEIRPLDRSRLSDELEILRDIFNDAWSGNWGFVPFTHDEFQAVGREMMMLLPTDFVQVARADGEPVAFIVMLPNLNEIIRDLDGALLPLGWAKLLWRLKVRFPRTARVPLMGVRRRYQHTPLGPGLALAVIDAVRQAAIRRGVETVELSWILEDNDGMRNIIERIGGRVSKRYRMYEKTLA